MAEIKNKKLTTVNRSLPVLGLAASFRPGDKDRVEEVLTDLAKLKVKDLRLEISWPDYATPQGKDWYAWLVPQLAQAVNLLPCFKYPFTAAPTQISIKNLPDVLNNFISDLGTHFSWIELSADSLNQSIPDNQQPDLAELLVSALGVAQTHGKKVVLGNTSPVLLQNIYNNGVLNQINAIGLATVSASGKMNWENTITQTQAALKKYHSSADIWITEAGLTGWQPDEFQQLAAFRVLLNAQVAKVYWCGLQDSELEDVTAEDTYVVGQLEYSGLKQADGRPKLLYRLWAENGLAGLNALTCLQHKTTYHTAEKYSLITGGAGFVGTNLAKRLLEEGRKVLILDNLSRTGVEHNLQWLYDNYPNGLAVCVGDIRDLATVKKVVQGADQVFHFAAQVAVTTSLDKPINDFEINARGTLNLLEAIRAQKTPPPLVFTSTNKVYGGLEDLQFISNGSRYNPSDKNILLNGIGEDRPLDFHSPYGCSKGAADQYVIDYARTYHLPAVVFRMSCIYGPHQYGNEDQGWVAHFAIRAIENKAISIYGDGKQVRDVLFVEDLVDAFLLAQKHMPDISGQAFNIGGGAQNTTSLLELLQMIGEFQGHKIPLNFDKWRPGDQHYYVSDIRKFKKATGWYPKHSVQEGVSKLYRWLCEVRGVTLPTDFSIVEENENTKVALA